jgi:hypothetical protein
MEVAPFAASAAPMMEEPTFASAPSFSSSVDSSMGDDEPSGGKGALIAIIVVLLAGGGAGAWWFMGRTPEAPPPTEPAGPTKVIQAGAIPDDTQEPDVAKGGDASRTPSITIKAAPDDDRRPSSSGSRPSSSSSTKPAKPEKGRTDSIKVDSNDDPLAGVR